LQYDLQNQLRGTDWEWGVWNAAFTIAFIPSFLAFAVLCRRYNLSAPLRWGTLIAIPQFAPPLFAHSIGDAMIVAVVAGLLGGFATAGYVDLIMRSCPEKLRGATLMLAGSVYFFSLRGGDLLGSVLYDRHGGFSACVVATTCVYALIIPLLGLVSPDIVDHRDQNGAESSLAGEGRFKRRSPPAPRHQRS
jgi:hypothetical protein